MTAFGKRVQTEQILTTLPVYLSAWCQVRLSSLSRYISYNVPFFTKSTLIYMIFCAHYLQYITALIFMICSYIEISQRYLIFSKVLQIQSKWAESSWSLNLSSLPTCNSFAVENLSQKIYQTLKQTKEKGSKIEQIFTTVSFIF